jgi:hypothetical protein
MAKSPKSRGCKVRGLAGGGLFDIGVYTFSRPRRVAIYILKTTRLVADYGTVYLHLKTKKLLKNRKGLSQESNSLKTDSWPVVNRGLTRLRCTFLLAYLLDCRLLSFHRPIPRLTIDRSIDLLVHRQIWAPLTIDESYWLTFLSLQSADCLDSLSVASPCPF